MSKERVIVKTEFVEKQEGEVKKLYVREFFNEQNCTVREATEAEIEEFESAPVVLDENGKLLAQIEAPKEEIAFKDAEIETLMKEKEEGGDGE